MIAHEHLHLVNKRQVGAVVLAALIAAVLLFASDSFLSPSLSFFVSFALLTGIGALAMLLVQRSGVFLLYYGLVGLLTMTMSDAGVTGVKKILVYLIAALAYEVVFLFLKLHVHFLAADIVVGGALSGALIPFFSALLLAGNFVIQLQVLNLMLLGLVAALCGSVVACSVWHYVKNLVLLIEMDMWLRDG